VSDVVVIGVGNRVMGDDAAGPVVIDRLAGRVPDDVGLVESVGDATHLLETWRGRDLAVVVDAIVSGGVPGSVHRIDGLRGVPAAWRSASTHLVGLGEAVQLGAAVGVLPRHMVLFGIEISSVEPGIGLDPDVDRAVDSVVASIVQICDLEGEAAAC
jgi:hydrogenase maturation protease